MNVTHKLFGVTMAASMTLMCGVAFAQKGETVKIAWIDPLTGLMGPVGNNQVKSFQFVAERFNKNNPAGVKFEIIPIDNKLSPAETLNRPEVGHRPRRALCDPGQWLGRRCGAGRSRGQTQ